MIYNTYVFNPIRDDFIGKALETLYKFTDMSQSRVIVVDQTMNGLFENFKVWSQIKPQIHLYLRPHRNLGFSKSMNEGIIHGLRWKSKYITCANDDIEFIDNRWWKGITDTFEQDEKIYAVNPNSPREPGWGYGLEHGKFIDLLPYKQFSSEDYDYLLKGDFKAVRERIMASGELPEQVQKNWESGLGLPASKTGMIDAIATWCTVFRSEFFGKFGMFDEKIYPGGLDDYDLNARVYREGYRMVGTSRSWVFHFWGSSKDTNEHVLKSLPILDELRWADGDALWPPEKNLSWDDETKSMQPKKFDPWGRVTLKDGSKKPMYRIPEIHIMDI